MDRNLFFALGLSFLVLTAYSTWRAQQEEQDKGQQPVAESVHQEGSATPAEAPTKETLVAAPARPATAGSPSGARAEDAAREQVLVVDNDLYSAELTSLGAGIRSWKLKRYRARPDEDAPPVELAPTSLEGGIGMASAMPELGLGDLSAASFHLTESSPTSATFELARDGIRVRKRFEFAPDSYVVRLLLEVENQSPRSVEPRFDVSWPATVRPGSDFANESLIVLHQDGVSRSPLQGFGTSGITDKVTGRSGGDPVVHTGDVDWIGVDSHYFLAAIVTDHPRDGVGVFEPRRPGEVAAVRLSSPGGAVPPGLTDRRELRAYVGPKEGARLLAFGSGVDRSVELGYAWVAPLTRAFLWLLHASYGLLPNYGVGIILLTGLVRLVTAPLTARQMRSMKKMAELKPRMDAIQEKHKDDRQKQSEETMKLYKEAGVNPFGGCVPILLQFPVFIGLYSALQSAIDLRQAPFVGWINDLSAPEALFMLPGLDVPVRLLPIIMGASMVLQQKLTPTSPSMDPAQAKMMMTVMPVMFTALFYQFPSGLVLYWFVSNLLAISHQLWMNRTQTTTSVGSAANV